MNAVSTVPNPIEHPPSTSLELLRKRPGVAWPFGLALFSFFVATLTIWIRSQELLTISFWFDEACSWKVSQFPIVEMLDANGRDAHPPLYYFVCKLWNTLFGSSVLSARSLSLFFAVMGTGAAAWLLLSAKTPDTSGVDNRGQQVWCAAGLAALLIMINPLQVEMSQAARSYSLGIFLALLSSGFLVRATQHPGQLKYWVGFTLSASAMTMTHYYALFTFGGMLVYLFLELIISLWKHRFQTPTRQLLLGSFCSLWAIQLIWSPWISTFLFQRSRSDSQLWMAPLTWSDFAHSCWQALAAGKSSAVWPDWVWWGFGTWVALAAFSFQTGGRVGRLIGICALVPLVCIVTYGYCVRNILSTQYLIYAQTFALMSVATLALPNSMPALRWPIVLILLGWNLFWLGHYREQRSQLADLPGTQGAIAYVNDMKPPAVPLIIASPFVHTIALQYLASRENCHTYSYGDHRNNLLSGPALQEQDYNQTSEVIQRRPPELWTIDAGKLFGSGAFVTLPAEYLPVSEQTFPERYGFDMDLIVRKYVLRSNSSFQVQ